MTDTSPEVAQIVREKLMSRSAEERFLMGIEMFEVARAIVDASLPSELSAAERRQRRFQRLYGIELPQEMRT